MECIANNTKIKEINGSSIHKLLRQFKI